MIVVTGVRTGISEGEQAAIEKATGELPIKRTEIKSSCIIKSSVDARRRTNMSMVYSVGFELADQRTEALVVKMASKPNVTQRLAAQSKLEHGTEPLESRPVVAGFGPAGMFAALVLAQNGFCPIVLERGADLDARVAAVEGFWQGGRLDTQTNVQFGEGGAGTFSDGKLTTRISDARCETVLGELARFGAPKEILYKAKPHIGTDKLRAVVKAMRKEIISLGGEIRFTSQLTDFTLTPTGLAGVTAGGDDLPARVLVLAVGHSARDTFALLREKQIDMEVKPFSVGVRIEHLQSEVNKSLFGEFSENRTLGAGEYQLSHKHGERAVYTFCMCPGGIVVPAASEEGGVVVNGMSEFARDKINANSALVVSVDKNDFGSDPMDAIAFQRGIEQAAFRAGGSDYKAPAQTVGEFLKGRTGLTLGAVKPSYANGVKAANMLDIFPQQITDMMRLGLVAFGGKLKCFTDFSAVMTGVETRTSSPVRIMRGGDGCAVGAAGIYPCGEGAGYAGGIVSSAVDGIKTAEHIVAKYKPKW